MPPVNPPSSRPAVAPLVFSHPEAELPENEEMTEGTADSLRHVRFSARPAVAAGPRPRR